VCTYLTKITATIARGLTGIWRDVDAVDDFIAQKVGCGGYVRKPMFSPLPYLCLVFCVLHALMSIGRNMVEYIHNAMHKQQASGDKEVINDILKMFADARIKVDPTKRPLKQTWNVKGIDAAKILRIWPQIAMRLGVQSTIPLMGKILRAFKIMFTFDFVSDKDKAERDWFKANIKTIMTEFILDIAYGRESHYAHEIMCVAAYFLDHGGLWAFSNDSQETLNCEIKRHVFFLKHFCLLPYKKKTILF
jgi:hypothetical protein